MFTGKNSRILIIDDNPAIHADFAKILNPPKTVSVEQDAAEMALFGSESSNDMAAMCSFPLDSAYQGDEGLQLVKTALEQARPYAMAFVDVRMPPGMDGVETTAKLWEIDPDLQVVICTAYSDYSWQEMLRKLNHSDRLVILKKPFDYIEVLQLANSLTRKWQLLQESKHKMADLEQLVVARTAQMVEEQEKFRSIFENSPEGIFQLAFDGRLLTANPALAGIYGYTSASELTDSASDSHTLGYTSSGRWEEFKSRMEKDRIVREFESEIQCKDGTKKWISETACKVTKLDGALLYYQGFIVDITAQKNALKERNLMETQLLQAQKLESVGQLAAGIAHEINTPIQYIGDNIRFVEESFGQLSQLLANYQKLSAATESKTCTEELLTQIESSGNKVDLSYLMVEIPSAVRQSLDGVNHVANVIRAMKEFSHPGSKEMASVDLNRAIETTITVARNEWKYLAEIVTDFAPDLPRVLCHPAELNQVILNLIVNAAHAIGDVVKDKEGTKGTIRITTRWEDSWIEMRIADTGAGIPEAIRHHIFEPFFTTKEVGKGTGQGLALARSTIVKKHGGTISYESTVGQGTTFIVRLPVRPATQL